MSACAGAAVRRAALSAEILAAISLGINLVTSVPLPGQLNAAAVSAGVKALAAHPGARLTALDYGSCASASRAFKDALREAVAGVLAPGRVAVLQDPQMIRRFPASSAYFTSSRNPGADGFLLVAREAGLTVIDEPTLENLRAFVLGR
ncbi:MAG: hypothetical protein ACYC9Q_03230 [Bacillota bacterium]